MPLKDMATSLTVAISEILLSEFCHDWQPSTQVKNVTTGNVKRDSGHTIPVL